MLIMKKYNLTRRVFVRYYAKRYSNFQSGAKLLLKVNRRNRMQAVQTPELKNIVNKPIEARLFYKNNNASEMKIESKLPEVLSTISSVKEVVENVKKVYEVVDVLHGKKSETIVLNKGQEERHVVSDVFNSVTMCWNIAKQIHPDSNIISKGLWTGVAWLSGKVGAKEYLKHIAATRGISQAINIGGSTLLKVEKLAIAKFLVGNIGKLSTLTTLISFADMGLQYFTGKSLLTWLLSFGGKMVTSSVKGTANIILAPFRNIKNWIKGTSRITGGVVGIEVTGHTKGGIILKYEGMHVYMPKQNYIIFKEQLENYGNDYTTEQKVSLLKGLSRPVDLLRDANGTLHIEHSHDMRFQDFIEKMNSNNVADGTVPVFGDGNGYDNPEGFVESYHEEVLLNRPEVPLTFWDQYGWYIMMFGKSVLVLGVTVTTYYGLKVVLGGVACLYKGKPISEISDIATYNEGMWFFKGAKEVTIWLGAFAAPYFWHFIGMDDAPKASEVSVKQD